MHIYVDIFVGGMINGAYQGTHIGAQRLQEMQIQMVPTLA
jgi:hypothetical protein